MPCWWALTTNHGQRCDRCCGVREPEHGVVLLCRDGLFRVVGMEALTGPGRGIWQCLGMVIGVFGIGYLCASRDPVRHWPIVLVGFLGKIFGPVGFLWTASRGEIPWMFGATIPTNDLI